MRGWRFGLLVIICTVWATASGRADLDPAAAARYDLQVVLLAAEHRVLTALFREQLAQAIRAELEQRLGKVAAVQVVASHPLARQLQARGWEALDGWEETSQRQTHFVTLDFTQGRYVLAARAYDGWIAAAAPATRRATTTERAAVGRLAADLVEQAFAVGGTVTRTGADVVVTLRGGAIGPGLERWAAPGAVLAVSRVIGQGESLRAERLAWTVLEATTPPQDGILRCRLWRRYEQDDLGIAPGVAGYRCQVLPTLQAPVRLRVVDEATGRPLEGVQVTVTQPGTKKKVELSTDRHGLAVTGERFQRLALVDVALGAAARARLPVELVDERIVVCRLQAGADAETRAGLELRRDQWLRRLYDELRVAAERVPALNLLLSKSLEAALEHARHGQDQLTGALDLLTQERDQLARSARAKNIAEASLGLHEGDDRLGDLKKRQAELAQFVMRVETALKEAQSETTQTLTKLLERARLLEQEAEFDQALAAYDQVLAARPDQEAVKKHVEQLRAAWAVKGPQHAKARTFLLQVWPRLDAARLADHLKEAADALAACRAAGDRLTPQRLLLATPGHVARLQARLETLRRQDTEDSRTQLKAIAEVADGLRRLHAAASAP